MQSKNRPKTYYLDLAGFNLKVEFAKGKLTLLNNLSYQYLQKFYIQRFYKLNHQKKRVDFEIKIVPESNQTYAIERLNKKYFFLNYEIDFDRKIAWLYSSSLASINFLFKEVLSFLLDKNGLLLHCSSVIDGKNKLFIFLGKSGSGKTTTANLLAKEGFRKFSDDSLVAKKENGRWFYYSPPYIEKEEPPLSISAKDANFYFIEKSSNTTVQKMKNTPSIIKAIMKQIWTRKGNVSENVLKNILNLVSNNNFYKLKIRRDGNNLAKKIYET
jgi:hypothetical protein